MDSRSVNKAYCSLVGGLSALFAVYLASSVATAAPDIFTNSFYVKLRGAHTDDIAHQLAKRNGFVNLGPVSSHSWPRTISRRVLAEVARNTRLRTTTYVNSIHREF